jgi:hypothetical protein
MAKPGMTQPDLVSDLSTLQKRLDDLERKPVPTSLYDSYPCMNWETVGRNVVGGNQWSSVGVANVTGLKYDRVEAKFLADKIVAERSEAELRLAAFKHSHTTQAKTCIAASSTVRLTGNWDATPTNSAVGLGKWRWIHNIPRGWNVDSDDLDAIYTIELQHRYNDATWPKPEPEPDRAMLWGFWKMESEDGKVFNPEFVRDKEDGGRIAAGLSWAAGTNQPHMGWVDIPSNVSNWDGTYRISNMHYCVGMAAEQLPEATEAGWFWYSGGDVEIVRQPDITEAYINF